MQSLLTFSGIRVGVRNTPTNYDAIEVWEGVVLAAGTRGVLQQDGERGERREVSLALTVPAKLGNTTAIVSHPSLPGTICVTSTNRSQPFPWPPMITREFWTGIQVAVW